MPDFAQVYNFLGSIFDPETSGHLQRLREMDPIDVETVCPSLSFLFIWIVCVFFFFAIVLLCSCQYVDYLQ